MVHGMPVMWQQFDLLFWINKLPNAVIVTNIAQMPSSLTANQREVVRNRNQAPGREQIHSLYTHTDEHMNTHTDEHMNTHTDEHMNTQKIHTV